MEILNGIDIERISRFEKLIGKSAFMTGVYTQEEQSLIAASDSPVKRAAAAFSAKEAVSKAFGRGLYGMRPQDIEVLRDDCGRPQVRLLGKAKEDYGKYSITLSISYKDDYVVTSCIAYRP